VVSVAVANERSPLLIGNADVSTRELDSQSPRGLEDTDQREYGESQRSPMDECIGGLVGEDGEEAEADGEGTWKITFRGTECVASRSHFEGEEGKEDEDFGPSAWSFNRSIETEGFEGGNNGENSSPAVVQGEGEMDEKLVVDRLRTVIFLHNIVDMSDSARDEKNEDESSDIMIMGREADIDAIEDSKERESPRNSVNDDFLASREELVDNCTKKEEMN